ncbi:MAG: GTP-binding protein, partial [Terriglobia bacterium]
MNKPLAAADSIPATPLAREVERRRTFAIISHPDAGKTTLTEKLLLFGGAINLAGQVKAKRDRRATRSDWMAIERERGISVVTSVMTFEHAGCVFNLLDTPGHEDFSEDTYRTLTAVDSAVMVIDAAKGIEARTRKLFEVCRLRDIPIITFINKIDREGEDPLTLLDLIASDLALDLVPMGWPVGMGTDFRGVLDLAGNKILLPETAERGALYGRAEPLTALDDIRKIDGIDEKIAERTLEGVELAQGALPEFDLDAFR